MSEPRNVPPTYLSLARRQDVAARALRTAILVGIVLIAINHGDALLSRQVTLGQWLKMVLTFFVPYAVSTHASVQALRGVAAGIAD